MSTGRRCQPALRYYVFHPAKQENLTLAGPTYVSAYGMNVTPSRAFLRPQNSSSRFMKFRLRFHSPLISRSAFWNFASCPPSMCSCRIAATISNAPS